MSTSTVHPDIWSIVLDSPQIDAAELADSIEAAVLAGSLDFRTRLLIRDALTALARCWGDTGLARWLSRSAARARIEAIRSEDLLVDGARHGHDQARNRHAILP